MNKAICSFYAVLVTFILSSSFLVHAKDISSVSSTVKKPFFETSLKWSDFQEKGKGLNPLIMQKIKEQFDAYMGEYNSSKALHDLFTEQIKELSLKRDNLKKTDLLQKAKITRQILSLESDKKRNIKDMKRVEKNIKKLFDGGFIIEKNIILAQKEIQAGIANLNSKIDEYQNLSITKNIETLIKNLDTSLANVYEKMEFLLLNGDVAFVSNNITAVDAVFKKLKDYIEFIFRAEKKLPNISLYSDEKRISFETVLKKLTQELLPDDMEEKVVEE